MKFIDIAIELHEELEAPTDIIPAAIGSWLRYNFSKLNSLINTSLELNVNGTETTPELTQNEKAILKSLYLIHYYDNKVRTNLGAAGTDVVTEISSDGARFRKVNKTEVAKSYIQIRKDEQDHLKELINGYKRIGNIPRAVHGDDDLSPYSVA